MKQENQPIPTPSDILDQIEILYTKFLIDSKKHIGHGNKEAGVRARKYSLDMEKLMKEFRRTTIREGKKKDSP